MHVEFNSSIQNDAVPKVVGSGLVALDVLLGSNTDTYSALGGSTGNVLAILAYLGWQSVPVARLGKDAAADRIQHEFETLHADTRFLKQEHEASTPVVFQTSIEGGSSHKFSFHCPFCGEKRGYSAPVGSSVINEVLHEVTRTNVFYFDRVTPWALQLAESYRERGALIMFEPSSVGRDEIGFSRAIQLAHILKYAEDRISGLASFDRSNVSIEIQTLGKCGLRFRSRQTGPKWKTVPAFGVPRVADTAGAGDWCSAGLLYALFQEFNSDSAQDLNTDSLSKALRFGQILAALNCMHIGARGLSRHWSRDRVIETARSVVTPLTSVDDRQAMLNKFIDSLSQMKRFSNSQPDQEGKVEITELCCKLFRS